MQDLLNIAVPASMVRRARRKVSLTGKEAGRLIHVDERLWRQWEQPSRKSGTEMPLLLYLAFLTFTGQLTNTRDRARNADWSMALKNGKPDFVTLNNGAADNEKLQSAIKPPRNSKKGTDTGFGERFRGLREAHGFSLGYISERMKVTRVAVHHWDVGRAMPSAAKLERLAQLLGTNVDYLLSGKRPRDDIFARRRRPTS
jgi:DNA-binding transcriptional regulator YiaG